MSEFVKGSEHAEMSAKVREHFDHPQRSHSPPGEASGKDFAHYGSGKWNPTPLPGWDANASGVNHRTSSPGEHAGNTPGNVAFPASKG